MEFFDKIWCLLQTAPERQDDILRALSDHPEEVVRRTVPRVRNFLRQIEEQIKDIHQIRRISPLRPGTRLALSGGYHEAFSVPRWLNGRHRYKGTFIDFAERGAGKIPSALVELDNDIDVTELTLRHRGRHALLKLLYVSNWTETGIVTVHIVESVPEDHEVFYASHPFGTEIESHATYKILENSKVPGELEEYR